jgi:hypothetical protein
MLREKIILGSSNVIDLLFKRKDEYGIWKEFPLTHVTRAILFEVNGSWSIDSSSTSGVFSWAPSERRAKMTIKAGGETLTVGTYNCYVKIYMNGYPDGYVWKSIVQIEVIAEA